MKLLDFFTLLFTVLLFSALAAPLGQIQELLTKNSENGPDNLNSNSKDVNAQRVKRHYDGECYMCQKWPDGECNCMG
ncbi:hypothetical protein L596_030621 [Steinernema carpocapsae]|uniref:Uncharacterized protein n=1 Tax=Steinernema carpocapsae TaxID=34508 RepID=A0A4U5LPX0_STECR|nr:hypothetical protein L596_030621 [Steinernema carpocapsae]